MKYLDSFGWIPKTECQISLYEYLFVIFGVITWSIGSKINRYYNKIFLWIVLIAIEIPVFSLLYSMFYFKLIPVKIEFLNMVYWMAIMLPVFLCVQIFMHAAIKKLKILESFKSGLSGIQCISCGYENKIGSRFCGKCGNELKK